MHALIKQKIPDFFLIVLMHLFIKREKMGTEHDIDNKYIAISYNFCPSFFYYMN